MAADSRTRTTGPRAAAAVLLAFLLGLSACSGGTDDTTTARPGPDDAAETTETATDPDLTTTTEAADTTETDETGADGSEETTTSQPAGLEDSTEPDDTLAPPPSLVPTDFCAPTRVNGQAIRFQAGASEAVLRSPATPDQSDLYSVQVAANQILNITLTSTAGDAVATLLPPDGIFIPGVFTDTAVNGTDAGNYWICVISGDTSDQYELIVSVIDDNTPTKVIALWCGDNVNDRGEFRFNPGASSGQIDAAVIRGERDRYTFEAGANQRFSGELNAFEDNAAFQLRSPSGNIIWNTETSVDSAGFAVDLPESGVYEICVGATRGNATYTIDITIE